MNDLTAVAGQDFVAGAGGPGLMACRLGEHGREVLEIAVYQANRDAHVIATEWCGFERSTGRHSDAMRRKVKHGCLL